VKPRGGPTTVPGDDRLRPNPAELAKALQRLSHDAGLRQPGPFIAVDLAGPRALPASDRDEPLLGVEVPLRLLLSCDGRACRARHRRYSAASSAQHPESVKTARPTQGTRVMNRPGARPDLAEHRRAGSAIASA
jgi:hypothetical protein